MRFLESDIAAIARGTRASAVTVGSVADALAVEGRLAERRHPLVVDAMIRRAVVGYGAAQDFLGRSRR